MAYINDLLISEIYNRGESGLAMGKIPPGKGGSPGQPYDPPKPTGPYVPAPPRLAMDTTDSSIMNYVTEQGFFLDGSGKAYMQSGSKFYDAGEYNPDVHGMPVPLAEAMKINNQLIATHDKPLFKTPPATGAAGDNIANDLLIRTMKGLISPSTPKKPLG